MQSFSKWKKSYSTFIRASDALSLDEQHLVLVVLITFVLMLQEMLLFFLNKMSPEAHIKHKKEHAYFCKGPMKLKNSVPTKVEIKPTPLVG